MAVDVLVASSDRLQRSVCQHFTNLFISSAEDLTEEDNEEDLDALSTAHDLIAQLNKTAPAVLLNVIPQLGLELNAESLPKRTLATKTLGGMFAEKSGNLSHLAKTYPSIWKSWLGRSKDKTASVRIAVLDSLRTIWAAHTDLAQDVQGSYRLCCCRSC